MDTLREYLNTLNRTNNNEIYFTPEEKTKFDTFFKEHPKYEKLRQELLTEQVPEYREQIFNKYFNKEDNTINIEDELKEFGINLKGIKDITLDNKKRILVIAGVNGPTVIDYNAKANLLEELRKRQSDYSKYQGMDSNFNVEELLKDIAKEQKSYVYIKSLDNYIPSEKVMMDKKKLEVIEILLREAKDKNRDLMRDDRFAYIDEENNYIMTKNGRILEAKKDMSNNIVVQSAKEASEYKNEEVKKDNNTQEVNSNPEERINPEEVKDNAEQINDNDYSDKEIEYVYEEIFAKGGYPDEKKAETIKKLNEIKKHPELLEKRGFIPTAEKEFYYEAYGMFESLKMKNTKSLSLSPSNKNEGSSYILYIALIVLVIAFAILMYIIFRR